MKKGIFVLLMSLALPMTLKAQNYSALWKNVETADSKDLQQDKLAALGKIAAKAERDKQYGHLFKALLMEVLCRTNISPDSLESELHRLELREKDIDDKVSQAVFRSALGRMYSLYAKNLWRDKATQKTSADKSKRYYALSLENPDLLASVKTSVYEPLVEEESYSKIFNDDMLHVLGFEARAYKTMHDYYAKHGNRNAACITALEAIRQQRSYGDMDVKKSRYLQSVDSLINVYGDLKVAGELAVEHYKCLENIENATAAEKVQYINYAVNKWGTWPNTNYLRNAKMELERPMFNINVGDVMLLPDVARTVRINSIRNISQLDFSVYRLSLAGDVELDPYNEKDYQKIQKHIVGKAVYTNQLRYVGKAAYDEFADSMSICPLPVGMYLLEATADNKSMKTERCLLHVSNLYTMSETLPGKKMRIAVVEATTGKPVANAKVKLFFNTPWRDIKYDDEVAETGKNGELTYDCSNKKPYRAYVYTASDNACAPVAIGTNYYSPDVKDYEQSVINTDRSIYRPGDKVNVSVVYWQSDSKKLTANPLVGKEVTLKLRDANFQEVAAKVVTTDEYGQASAVFDIPTAGLTGRYTLSANNSSKPFRVEKYKKPTFSVEIDKVKTAYSAGDTLTLKGVARTFAGMPVQNGKVRYTVRRNMCSWWRYWDDESMRQTLFTDSVATDDKGAFTLRLPMILPEQKGFKRMYFNIEATADVTDVAGETQQGFMSLPLSNVATVFTCDLPEKNLADSLTNMTFGYKNITGENIAASVTYTIDGKNYDAEANRKIDLTALKLHSGLHSLKAVCGTDTIERKFIVFSLADKKAPVETHDWFYQSSETFPATIQVGNTDAEHHIYYNVFTNGKYMVSGIMEGHNTLHNQTFDYKEEYGDGITVTYAWVNRGHLYTHTASIHRPQPDKKLNMEWTSFRDKLTPGQKERWTLKITTPDGKPATAQLMATLYDKSLDVLKSHSLKAICSGSFFRLFTPYVRWNGGSNMTTGLYGYQDVSMLAEKPMLLSHFSDDCFIGGYLGSSKVFFATCTSLKKTAALESASLLASDSSQRIGSQNIQKPEATDAAQEAAAGIPPQLRENFSETAYFAPALTTDDKGTVAISFTLPESVTTWHFLAQAHDKQMNSATIEAEAVVSKKVMVQPNMPRFVRYGDKAVIVSRISNTTSENIKGNIKIEIADPATGKVVYTDRQNFSLEGKEAKPEEFEVSLPEGLYVCRIVAEGKGFSDGEQHYLPVLSDKEMVTATMSFTQTEVGKLSLPVDSVLPANGDNRRLTVEYTNNPAWFMIQALPTVSEYCNQSSISLAAAYYATAMSLNILKGSPEIKDAIDGWKTDGDALMSDLQRNEELKSIVLTESPWMMEAGNESGQKALLATYYNKNNLGYKLSAIRQLLEQNQNDDGSFSWLKGMTGSPYVTVSVATLMARLNASGYTDTDIDRMLAKALGYLDNEAAKRMADMKKDKHPYLSSADLDYLYLCTISKAQPSASVGYFKSLLLKTDRKVDIRTKAVAAIALGKDNATAHEYVESIKQYTVSKPGMGRYFDTPKAAYSWRNYRIPTHVAAIEAIAAITPEDKTTIDEMRLWLLQQKRTQIWDTPLNSVDAIHAFLAGNEKVLEQHEQTRIALDGTPLATPEATAAIGYVKTKIDNPMAKTISFDKTADGTSWGAIYGQTLMPISQVKAADNGIKVERRLATEGKELKVGDKVKVVISITADRNYDFVQVCDKRAACLEPVNQLSGYEGGYYVAPQDNSTNYFFDTLAKGKHVIETEYFIDRQGTYHSGVCTAECAYSPEYSGRAEAMEITVK